MKNGNWIPLDKNLSQFLPQNRTYTKLEATFSITLDYDNNKPVTVSGYSKLWGWSRRQVRNFLKEIMVNITYHSDTKSIQNQRGQINVQTPDRYRAESGQIRAVNNAGFTSKTDRKRTDTEQKADRSVSTTNNPTKLKTNPNPNQERIAKPVPTSKSKETIKDLNRFDFQKKFVDFVLRKYSEESIKTAIQVLEQANSPDNPEAFFNKALIGKWKPRNGSQIKNEALDMQEDQKEISDDMKAFLNDLSPELREEFLRDTNYDQASLASQA
jgi:hypothetical protein